MTLILVDFFGGKNVYGRQMVHFSLNLGRTFINSVRLSGCSLKFLNVAGCYVNVNSSNNCCLIFRKQNSFGHKWDI